MKITWLQIQGNVILCALGKIQKNETFIFKDTIMNNSKEEKILRFTIDNKLILLLVVTSENYVKKFLKKAMALSRISNQLNDYEKIFFLTKSSFCKTL